MRGLPTVSTSLSTICCGVGMSGIAHAEVDDVGAARARRRLEAVDLGEDIGRQALDAMEVVDHGTILFTIPRSFHKSTILAGCKAGGKRAARALFTPGEPSQSSAGRLGPARLGIRAVAV